MSRYHWKLEIWQVTLLKYVCSPQLLPFALQFPSELQSTCDVAKISQLVVDPVVVNLLEVVQPNLGQSHGVLLENIGARSPLVWRSRPGTQIVMLVEWETKVPKAFTITEADIMVLYGIMVESTY